ncbi:MAG: Gfo/Idh/MocA family oxidoreductase [Saprospiraceae bacterium]|nr:Gfo/Idh/MocA family oxidoreductase [Saprospiraceae bacterium]
MDHKIRIGCVGSGYFAPFHIEAWKRIPEVELVAICDKQIEKADTLAALHGIGKTYADVGTMLGRESIQVLDIITPPDSHSALCQLAAGQGVHIICQKPLAPDLKEARQIIALAKAADVRFMVHENFRFQPWYRKIKKLINEGAIGDKLHTLQFRMRTGDGWSERAYLDRQPYFRSMPRLLIYETGIHFIDTFRYLAGEVKSVYADLRRLNPDIVGEDCGLVYFTFQNGARGFWDANRFNESHSENTRYTFGEMLVEGNGGCIRLDTDGGITWQPLGEPEQKVPYAHLDKNFGGDCVYFTQKHFVKCFLDMMPFETEGRDYLRNLEIQEAIYLSAKQNRPVTI